MKEFLSRWLNRNAFDDDALEHSRAGLSSEITPEDVGRYYHGIVSECLARMLVSPESVELSIRPAGQHASGRELFAGYVRILRWDPVITPVLLRNLPVLDARIRRTAAASVLLEHTWFEGLWFQALHDVPGAPDRLVGLPAQLVHQRTAVQ